MRTNSGKGTGCGPGATSDFRSSQERHGIGLEKRRDRRFRVGLEVHWDFFSIHDGLKGATIIDLSPHGCQLRTHHPIELRRWLRLLLPLPGEVVHACCVARTVWSAEESSGYYRYGIEFVRSVPAPWIHAIRDHSTAEKEAQLDARQMLAELKIEEGLQSGHSPLYASLLNGNYLR